MPDMTGIKEGDYVIETYGEQAKLVKVHRTTATQIIVLDGRGGETRYRLDGAKVGGYSRSTPFASRYEITKRGDVTAERRLERAVFRRRVSDASYALTAFEKEQNTETADALRNAVERLTQKYKS